MKRNCIESKNGRELLSKKPDPVLVLLSEFVLAGGMIALLIFGLWAHTGSMPPLVVVESESMMHSESGEVGAIDAGDLILVHSTPFEQIITFVEAANTSHASYGYEQHGMYGDVIIFKKNGGNETPIIHRAILEVQPTDFTSSFKGGEDPCPNGGIFDDEWLDENGEPGVCVTTWQIPGTSIQGVESITIEFDGIHNALYDCELSVFAHEGLSQHLSIQGWQPTHAGFLTLGDNNHCSVDQRRVISSGGSLDGPVRASWMIGTAGGEIPWLGTVKLMVSGPPSPGTFYVPSSSFTFLFLIVGVVFISPVVYEKVAKRLLSNSPEFQTLKYYPEEE